MKKWMTTLAVAVLMTAASNARAVFLPPTAFFPPPTVGVAPWGPLTFLGGTTEPYSYSSGSSSFSGTLTSLAYSEATGVTFFYQAHAVAGTEILDRMSLTGFKGFLTDAYWVGDAALLPPETGGVLGTVGYDKFTRLVPNTVGANFAGGLAPGSFSNWLVIRTDALTYSKNDAFLQDGGQAPTLAFSPAPLPGTFVLFGTGALGLVGLLRRKRTQPIEA